MSDSSSLQPSTQSCPGKKRVVTVTDLGDMLENAVARGDKKLAKAALKLGNLFVITLMTIIQHSRLYL